MIDLDALRRIADAGHPDSALVGVPVSMIREIERRLRPRQRRRKP